MIIDIHTHVGDLRRVDMMDRLTVTWERLIKRLDKERIDKAVFLPLGASPESSHGPFLFAPNPDVISQLKTARKYRDRIISFGNLDPRMGCAGNLEPDQVGNPPEADFSWIIERFIELDCAGIGEITANIAMDDPRMINMCRQCGTFGLPVLMHCTGPGRGVYGLYDEVGSPRLETLLRQSADTILIGHAPGFWAEISGNIKPENKFISPRGPIETEGSLPKLLRTHTNLYADLSANSGLNAISRDRAFGIRFLKEFQDQLLFGTDVCYGDEKGEIPTLTYLRNLLGENAIDQNVFDKITGINALKILKL